MTKKTEKISSLVANLDKAQESASFPEKTAVAFAYQTKDENFTDSEKRRAEWTGSQISALHQAEEGLLEEEDRCSASDRERRSKSSSVSTATRSRSSSVTSSSGSGSRSRPRSRPRPRCHRAPARSPCCRGRRRSPPRRYRARSRSYSPSYSPVRAYHRRSPARSRSPSRSTRRPPHGFVGRSSSRMTDSTCRRTRTRSKSRSPDRTSVHLSLQEKRDLLLIAREKATKAPGVEAVVLPSSLNVALEDREEPVFTERVRPASSTLNSLKENYSQNHAEQEVPCHKMSAKTKITFSIHNSVAKPVIGRSSSSPEKTTTVRFDIASGRNPYGRWVPVKARSFPLSASKRSTTKSR